MGVIQNKSLACLVAGSLVHHHSVCVTHKVDGKEKKMDIGIKGLEENMKHFQKVMQQVAIV